MGKCVVIYKKNLGHTPQVPSLAQRCRNAMQVSSPSEDEAVTPLFEEEVRGEGDTSGHGLRMFELAVEEFKQEQENDGPLPIQELLLEALAGATEDDEEELLAAEALAAEVENDQAIAATTPDDPAVVRKVPLPVPSIYHPREKGSLIEAPMVASLAAVFLWPTLLLLITICSTLLVTYFRVIRNIARIVYRSSHETAEEEHTGTSSISISTLLQPLPCRHVTT